MPRTAAQNRATTKYNAKAYEQIKIFSRREDRISEQIETAAARRGISKAAYILDALRAALDRDGISAADLPPVQQGEDTPPRLPARTATDGDAQEHGE